MSKKTFHAKYRDKRKQEARITNGVGSENQDLNQAASVACVLEDEETDEPVAVNEASNFKFGTQNGFWSSLPKTTF